MYGIVVYFENKRILHRKTKLSICLVLLALLCSVSVFSQEDKCIGLQKLIDKTYNFKPSKLTDAQQTAKSAEMDVVWNKVKANKEKLVPCLKKEMNKTNANNFFVFDAANLLFSLDKSDNTKKILLESYEKVDLEDIDPAYWIRVVGALGFEGFDTTKAAENWLKSSVDGYYLPQHGTRKVTKFIGSLAIYGSMDEKLATPALAKIASDEKHSARETAIILLMLQAIPESFERLKSLNTNGLSEANKVAIKKFLENPKIIKAREGKPKTTRKEFLIAFKELSEQKPDKFIELTIDVTDGEKDVVAVMKQEDIPLIRKARRYFAAMATPHTLEWYQSFTNILTTMIKKSETEIQK